MRKTFLILLSFTLLSLITTQGYDTDTIDQYHLNTTISGTHNQVDSQTAAEDSYQTNSADSSDINSEKSNLEIISVSQYGSDSLAETELENNDVAKEPEEESYVEIEDESIIEEAWLSSDEDENGSYNSIEVPGDEYEHREDEVVETEVIVGKNEEDVVILEEENQVPPKLCLTFDDVVIRYSGNWNGGTNAHIVDCDLTSGSGWNSGGFPTHWIEFEVKSPVFISKLQLIPSILARNGSLSSVILALFDFNAGSDSAKTLAMHKVMTNKVSEFLEVGFLVTKLRITTVIDDSWVAWNRVLFRLTS